MDEGFLCEAVGSLVVVRLTQPMSERVLEECQLCVLETMQQTGSKAVLYDLTEMEPRPFDRQPHAVAYERAFQPRAGMGSCRCRPACEIELREAVARSGRKKNDPAAIGLIVDTIERDRALKVGLPVGSWAKKRRRSCH